MQGKRDVDAMDCITEVLGREWFERMWCLQEVLLSHQAIVVCGAALLDWKLLVTFRKCCRSMIEKQDEFGPYIQCCDTWTLFVKDEEVLEVEDSTGETKSERIRDPRSKLLMMATFNMTRKEVAHFLQSARIRKAGDPRDKVFALFSIIHGVVGMGNAMETFPKPDYTKSVAEVYTAATICCLKSDTYATVLEYVYSRNRNKDLPSWVPDWQDPESQQLKSQDIQLQLGMGSGTEFRTEEVGGRHVLYLRGNQVGRVIRSSGATSEEETASRGDDDSQSALASQIATVQTFRRWVDVLDLNDGSSASRFRVSKLGEMLKNIAGVDFSKKKHDVGCYFSWIRLLRIANDPSERVDLISGFGIDWSAPPGVVIDYVLAKILYAPGPEALDGLDFMQEVWEFHRKVSHLARDWTVFMIDRTFEDVGIGLGNIAVGDVVVGLTRCRLLTVLKPQAHQYVMVSPASVLGITMTGGCGVADEVSSEFAII
jgi:hypothetical protein